MKWNTRVTKQTPKIAVLGSLALLGLSAPAVKAQTTVVPPFEQSAYLYNQAYDATYNPGTGAWSAYRAWLNLPQLGAEADGGWGNWWDSSELASWNQSWGTQQASAKYAPNVMPDILLGEAQMPDFSGGQGGLEDQTWALEAANDPATMQHFIQFAKNLYATPDSNNHWSGYVPSTAPKSVIVRLGYEFDGGWDPYGNLNAMSNMPANYILSWRNIVSTVRAYDPNHLIKFCWNPTDRNVQINSDLFYPGDAWVDYVGVDTYDNVYSGEYTQGTQPTAAQQAAAWNNELLPYLNYFTTLSQTHNKPLIVGEWGTVDSNSRPGGGDDPDYIQHMYNWMVANNVSMECYFDIWAPDGNHQLWPGGDPNNPVPTAFPKAAAKYRALFGASQSYGSAAAIPGVVQNENYDTGGLGIAYNSSGGGSSSYRSPDLVGIEPCWDTGGGYDVGWTSAGQWLKYTVNAAAAGPYTVSFRVASGYSGGTFHLQTLTGTNLTGTVTAPGTGGWQNWVTVTAPVTLPAGPQVLMLFEDTGGYNLNSMTFAGTQTGLVANGTYTLTNRYATSLLVDDPGYSKAIGVQQILYPNNGGVNQKWQLTNLGGNSIELLNAASGLALGVRGSATGNGAAVEQNKWTGASNQIWLLSATGSGYYTLTNKNSGLVLDDPGGSLTAGTGLMQFQYGGGTIDQWKFQ